VSRITDYAALATTQSDDLLPVVDVHDTSMAATGTTKKITVANLTAAAIAASLPTLAAHVTVTASGSLAVNTPYEADATSGSLTLTLPASAAGKLIVVEKSTAPNTVSVTGNIRGTGATTITLALLNESVMLFGDGTTWWPVAGHKTLSSLDGRYDASGAAAAAQAASDPAGSAAYFLRVFAV
jgi:hypothetical protein